MIGRALAGALLLLIGCAAPRPDAEREVVVLLHGLGRSSQSMRSMERYLAGHGYRVLNLRYPSRQAGLRELVENLRWQLEYARLAPDRPVHFVAHSAGGMVARVFLDSYEFPVGRVVLLAPPNRGSALAAALRDSALVRRLLGPLLDEFAEGPRSLPARLPPPDYPVGVIAGTRSALPFFSKLIPGDDDGIVGVDETRLDGMADFLTVERSHTWIMSSLEVQRQTLSFLRTGRFDRGEGAAHAAATNGAANR
jgi:pimeloyl-ACP methyl ester carboxylesterase